MRKTLTIIIARLITSGRRVTRLLDWRFSRRLTLLLPVGIWLGLMSCHGKEGTDTNNRLRVVRIPTIVWPGFKSVPDMDAVFRDLRPGDKVDLKLVFPNGQYPYPLVNPQARNIRKGSVFFYSKSGYFRLSHAGKVYSNPNGKQEVELDPTSPEVVIEIGYSQICNSNSTINWELRNQPLTHEEANGQYIGYITVELSADFEGELAGWRVYHGL